MLRIRARRRQVVRAAPSVLFVIDYLRMRSSKNDSENWSGQNRTSRTACYGHACTGGCWGSVDTGVWLALGEPVDIGVRLVVGETVDTGVRLGVANLG